MMDLRQRAMGAIVRKALLNLPNLIMVVTGGLFMALNVGGIRPIWPLVALAGIAINSILRLRSNTHNEAAVTEMLRGNYNVNAIKTAQVRQYVEKALEYRKQLDQAVGTAHDGPMKLRLADVGQQVENWIQRIYTLAQRLDNYHGNKLIKDDVENANRSIVELNRRLATEKSEAVRTELQETIARREQQRDALNSLDDTMERAELQIENTLSSMSIVTSQVMLLDAKDVDSERARRLSADINEQVASLDDTLSAMDDVHKQRSANLS